MPFTNLNINNLPYDESRFLTWTTPQRRRAQICDETVRSHELCRGFKADIAHWYSENGDISPEDSGLDMALECCQHFLEEWSNSIHYKNDEVQYQHVIRGHLDDLMECEPDSMREESIWDDCENFMKNL